MTDQSPRRTLSDRMVSILVMLGLVWIAWCGLLWFVQGAVIFPRGMTRDRVLPEPPAGAEIWTIDVGDTAPVEAWFFPADVAGPAPAVVIMHANAELIDDFVDQAHDLSSRGVHVLLPEFRGYGRSGGTPGEAAIVADTTAFVERLRRHEDVNIDDIAYIGRSIGCGVAAQVATHHEPVAMVLMMPPSRLDTMAWRFGLPPLLVRHPFRSDLALRDVDAPILIIARSHDEIIPASHPRLLDEIASNSELVVIEGTHNSVASEAEAERQRKVIREFLLANSSLSDRD